MVIKQTGSEEEQKEVERVKKEETGGGLELLKPEQAREAGSWPPQAQIGLVNIYDNIWTCTIQTDAATLASWGWSRQPPASHWPIGRKIAVQPSPLDARGSRVSLLSSPRSRPRAAPTRPMIRGPRPPARH